VVVPRATLANRDPDELAKDLAPYFGRDLATQPPIVMKQAAALGRHDVSARLAELQGIPTLVVSATHDTVAPPASGRRLAVAIDGARYVELEGSHGVTLMQPERVNALLREHLDRVEAGSIPPSASTRIEKH
jgi:pimeloyl-ACP methyl ester carboxylesterase